MSCPCITKAHSQYFMDSTQRGWNWWFIDQEITVNQLFWLPQPCWAVLHHLSVVSYVCINGDTFAVETGYAHSWRWCLEILPAWLGGLKQTIAAYSSEASCVSTSNTACGIHCHRTKGLTPFLHTSAHQALLYSLIFAFTVGQVLDLMGFEKSGKWLQEKSCKYLNICKARHVSILKDKRVPWVPRYPGYLDTPPYLKHLESTPYTLP